MAHPAGGLSECLYVTLAVERGVDPDKLKIAYRKMAMKWHPDKVQQSGGSQDSYQIATERFQMINHAYDVLSDPVERAWYDSHRERILTAPSPPSSASASPFKPTKKPVPSEFDLNIWPYFSPSAFSGFGDSGNGFYSVYRELFRKVHLQEQLFSRKYGNGSVGDAPELGGRETPYKSVYSFYRYWQGFSSVKDFAWCDIYDVLQAPNRKVRRLMEEENNKVRKRERKEFNNSVRQLAAFVKKRDKRVIEKQLELQKIQKQKDVERKARQLALEKAKQEQIRLYKEQAWTVPEDNEEYSGDDESEEDESDVKMDKTVEDLECMICGKRFKSVKQLQNHERSKKHLETLAALKGAFRNDDEQVERLGRQLGIDISIQKKHKRKTNSAVKEPVEESAPVASEPEVDDEDSPYLSALSDGDSTDQVENDTPSGESTSNESGVSDAKGEEQDDDDFMTASMLKFQRSRQMSESNVEEADEGKGNSNSKEKVVLEDEDEGEGEDDMVAALPNLQLNTEKASSSEVPQADGAGDAVEDAGASSSQNVGSALEERDIDEDEEEEEKVKKGSKGRRRAKQDRKLAAIYNRYSPSATNAEQSEQTAAAVGDAAADTGAHESSVRIAREPPQVKAPKLAQRGKKVKKEKKGAKQGSHTCQTCEEDFDSRSQLFKHIAESNHAILKSK